MQCINQLYKTINIQNLLLHPNFLMIIVNETKPDCYDAGGRDCAEITPLVCEKFPEIAKECRQSCGLCHCRDIEECEGITLDMCKLNQDLQKKCQKTCSICKPLPGKFFVRFITEKI